ncbi:MAG: hypothetical protein HOD64_05745 [Candidatus Cloacimonetes bacterium]|jgi:hypothetical protein|nr:hypothetical protein [Candidatus Cloacimonadota bacterium]MBT4332764.1 hypothetical protein [Candidatus Cloacimonadota bacterium]MBT4574880.1 hypothetical protein [Candidatus Cloacimonadota bacterium]
MNKLFIPILLFLVISCVINIGDVNQRHGELNKECKKLLKKNKEVVFATMQKLEMENPERVVATSDSTETAYFYKRYIKKRKNRFYDEVILDFKNDVLVKFKVDLVR